jgi:hypothetical protein
MRKTLLAIAGVLLLAVGWVMGWFAGLRSSSGPVPVPEVPAELDHSKPLFGPGSGVSGVRYRAGHQRLLDPAPSWEEWKYPDSRVHGVTKSGETSLGEIALGGITRVALTTPHDFDTVWAFYRNAIDAEHFRDGRPSNKYQHDEVDGKKVLTVTVFDNIYACFAETQKADARQARGFWVRSLRYNLVGLVFRARGGDTTDVLLLHQPNDDFLGLFKEKLVKD